jgi:hypothetical protein
MPRFYVRICKTELVLRSADVQVRATSAQSARNDIQRRIDDGEDFYDAEWFDSDTTDADGAITITEVHEGRQQ